MGLNTENLFVRSISSDAVLNAIEEYLDMAPHSEARDQLWPLEVTFGQTRVVHGRKVSVSDALKGWVAVVDASGCVEPRLAIFLSQRLATRVAVAQVYEVTDSSGFALVDEGVPRGGPTRHDLDDSLGAIRAALAREGVPFAPVLFRDTVGRNVVGWRTISRRAMPG